MKYFNTKYNNTVETIDELNPKDFPSYKEYRKELRNMLYGYREAGIRVWLSQRCTKDWKR